jgi:hypothetical protein
VGGLAVPSEDPSTAGLLARPWPGLLAGFLDGLLAGP